MTPDKAKYFVHALESLPDGGYAVEVRPPSDLAKNIGFRVFQAIYLFEVADPRQETWQRLAELVNQGVGLGIVPGGEEMNRLAYAQDAARQVMPGTFEKKVTQGADDGKNPGAVWNFDDEAIYQHPFMAPYREWKNYDPVKDPRQAFAFWEVKPFKDAVEIVFYKTAAKKYPALLERAREICGRQKRQGPAVQLTPLDIRPIRWNDYLQDKYSTYVVMVGQATKYLTGEADAPKLNFIAGQDEPALSLPPVVK